MLALRCCMPAFSSCGEGGYSLVVMGGRLIAVVSLVAEHGFRCVAFSTRSSWALEHGLSSGGTWDLLLCSMWNLPRPSIKPVSPALADGFLTAGPPGKSHYRFL